MFSNCTTYKIKSVSLWQRRHRPACLHVVSFLNYTLSDTVKFAWNQMCLGKHRQFNAKTHAKMHHSQPIRLLPLKQNAVSGHVHLSAEEFSCLSQIQMLSHEFKEALHFIQQYQYMHSVLYTTTWRGGVLSGLELNWL